MNIIIPIGGTGKRFQKAGYKEYKPMITIGKKRILGYLLDFLEIYRRHGDDIYIIYHSLMKGFNDWISNDYPFIKLLEIEEPTRGPVETILLGLKKKMIQDKQTLILDCDTFYTCDILGMVRAQDKNGVFFFREEIKSDLFSYIEMIDGGQIIKIVEKNGISDYACTGAYFFKSSLELKNYCKMVIDLNINYNNEYYTSCLIDRMISDGNLFYGIELMDENNVVFLGTPEQTKRFCENLHLYCFDLDGTLVNTDEIYLNVWGQLLSKINVDLGFFKKYIQGNDDKTVLTRLNSMIDESDINKISKKKEELFRHYLDSNALHCIEGAREFIEFLYLNGNDIYIITNSNREAAEHILKHFDICKMVDGLIIGGECPKSKPHPDPYLEAINRSRFDKNKCFIFEDSKTGLLSANSVFPKCIIGIESSLTKAELACYGADITISDYKKVYSTIISHKTSKKVENLKHDIIKSLKFKGIKKIILTYSKLKGGYIADVIEVDLYFDDKIDKAVLKYESNYDTNLTKMAYRLNLFKREYYFYESVQKYIPLKTPLFKGLIYNEDLKPIGVLLDNLKNSTIQLKANIDNIDLTLKIIRQLASMHAKFWNKDLESLFPLLTKHNDERFDPFMSQFIKENWDKFEKSWSFLLNQKQIFIGRKIVENFGVIQSNLSKDNLTICHGDVKYGNILFERCNDSYEPIFIDWQYISIGKGIQDIIFLLIESYEMDVLNLYKEVFIQYYYCELIKNGVNYEFKDYQKDIKDAASFFPFFVAIWFGTTPRDELIDINFSYFFIQKYFKFIEYFYSSETPSIAF